MFPRGRRATVEAVSDSQLGAVGPILPHVRQAPLRHCLKQRFVADASTWIVHKTASPFNRRVTAVEWHPVYHNVVAFASHGGDIRVWNFENPTRDLSIRGLGYGHGCVTSMKFHPENPRFLYTTSVDGRFCLQDVEGRQSNVFLDTGDIAHWWCSADFSREHNAIFVGDNTGQGVILDSRGEVFCNYKRLHRGKIKFAEFCHAGGKWLLATASVDHTVALWDIRMLRDQPGLAIKGPTPVSVLAHTAPINSATFDPQHGSRLLTTAQNSELRVYDASTNWGAPTTVISHPHRHFQHMTDIVASWHPMYDGLCVVGRYPGKDDSDQSRCVDLVDVDCGKVVGSLYSPTLKGIIVLNKFSRCGGRLASGMGYHCLLWQPEREVLRQVRAKCRGSRDVVGTGLSGERPPKKRRKRDDETRKKLKMKKL